MTVPRIQAGHVNAGLIPIPGMLKQSTDSIRK
jgi:hypothetical protein